MPHDRYISSQERHQNVNALISFLTIFPFLWEVRLISYPVILNVFSPFCRRKILLFIFCSCTRKDTPVITLDGEHFKFRNKQSVISDISTERAAATDEAHENN